MFARKADRISRCSSKKRRITARCCVRSALDGIINDECIVFRFSRKIRSVVGEGIWDEWRQRAIVEKAGFRVGVIRCFEGESYQESHAFVSVLEFREWIVAEEIHRRCPLSLVFCDSEECCFLSVLRGLPSSVKEDRCLGKNLQKFIFNFLHGIV